MTLINNVNASDSTATETISVPDLKPPAPATASPDTPTLEEPMEPPAAGQLAGKQVERDLEVAYFKGELDKAQHGSGVGVLYSHPQHNPGAGAVETRSAADASSNLIGMRLGWSGTGEQVTVKREVGSSEGYDNRWQATAAARLNAAEPAVVLQAADGKWHAVETTANISGGRFAPADNSARQLYGLPSFAAVTDDLKKLNDLEAKLNNLDAKASNAGGYLSKADQQERDDVVEQLKQARVQAASDEFGVPESEINLDSAHPVPGKINLVPPGTIDGDGRTEADLQTGSIVTKINADLIKHPARAMDTLFHEGVHVKDDELTHDWLARYAQEPHGKQSFETWISAQAAHGRISPADAETVVNIAAHGRTATEARAHVRAALAALEAGDPADANAQLADYAGNTRTQHHPGGRYGNPDSNSAVETELKREIQAAYSHMSPQMQSQFRDAIAAAKAANPESWVSQLKLSN